MAPDRATASGAALLREGEVQVWCLSLAQTSMLAAPALALLAPDERDRAERFRFPRLRSDFALTRAVLRILLGQHIGCPPEAVSFVYGSHGKPALASGGPLRFNVAHSGGFAVYALTSDLTLGVDVEHRRPMRDLDQIATRFFSAEECADLLSLPPADRDAAFFECWVRKEAYIKAVGQGLSIPLDSFRVSLLPDEAPALLRVRDNPLEPPEWSLQAFSPAPGYHGAVAVRRSRITLEVLHVHATDVFHSLQQ